MKKTWLTGVCAATTLLVISPLHAQEARPKLYAELANWTNYFKRGGIEQSLGLYRVKT